MEADEHRLTIGPDAHADLTVQPDAFALWLQRYGTPTLALAYPVQITLSGSGQLATADRLYSGYLALTVSDDLIDALYEEKMPGIASLRNRLTAKDEEGNTYQQPLAADKL